MAPPSTPVPDVHILQWMHGCEADMRPDGNLVFHSGMDTYSYDGRNFLSFNDAQKKWEAEDVAANPTKEKWDGVKVLSDYTKGYLENECLDWLKKFLNFRNESVGTDRTYDCSETIRQRYKPVSHVW